MVKMIDCDLKTALNLCKESREGLKSAQKNLELEGFSILEKHNYRTILFVNYNLKLGHDEGRVCSEKVVPGFLGIKVNNKRPLMFC